MKFTVVGASGFIGSALVKQLYATENHQVFVPEKNAAELFIQPLGHVIYAAGVTADFRRRPFDTLRAHVSLLAELLERAEFDSLLYLSSARIYRHAEHTGEEAAIFLRSHDPEDYYDLTKLSGEALCFASMRKNVRAVRLSNVVGTDFRSSNFLFELIRAACDHGHIELRSALDSEKDYVLVEDVVRILPEIAMHGHKQCYNLATGCNLRHAAIVNAIKDATGASFSIVLGAPRHAVPQINIQRLQAEFGFHADEVLPRIPELVGEYRKYHDAKSRS